MASTAQTRSVRYAFIAILALLAMLIGFTGDRILPITVDEDPVRTTAGTPEPTNSPEESPEPTEDPLAKDPAPPLLDSGDLSTVNSVISAQEKPADRLMKRWFADNGTSKADSGFVSWAAAQLPAEPTTIQRQAEQKTVKDLAASGNAATNRATEWLNEHGCEDVWISFTTQQLALRSSSDAQPSVEEITAVLKLAAEVASAAQDRNGSPAASQEDPCSGETEPARSDCQCNYPSSQGTMAAAARSYLGGLSPYRYDQYAWMERQVGLAALFAELELPSDIGSGALLGDLVGQYFLVTRGHVKP